MRSSLLPSLIVALGLLLPGAAARGAQELTLSAAISMKGAVEELGGRFMLGHPGVTLRYNFGASGDLQRQIEAGAPIDLFISAAGAQMDALEKERLILPATRRAFARNALAVVAPADSRLALQGPRDLLRAAVQRIAIGNPKTVPVGRYAEESLRALGLWEALRPKLVFAENVRQALEYVARGEVDAGFVYTTDAAVVAGRVREAFRPPGGTYGPVVYPAAVVAASAHPDVGRAFIDLLAGPEGRAVLTRLGFQPPQGGDR